LMAPPLRSANKLQVIMAPTGPRARDPSAQPTGLGRPNADGMRSNGPRYSPSPTHRGSHPVWGAGRRGTVTQPGGPMPFS
jgi:hypothetical protein